MRLTAVLAVSAALTAACATQPVTGEQPVQLPDTSPASASPSPSATVAPPDTYQVSPRHEARDPFTGLTARQALRRADRAIARAQRQRARERAARLAAKQAKREEEREQQLRQGGGIVFGDSVSLGAESCLNSRGYSVVAEVGRTFEEGFSAMRATSDIPHNVVVHLGTNGPFSESRFHDVMDFLGPDRHVTWVTIALPPKSQYAFRDSQNDLIVAAAAQYENTSVAEWADAGTEQPGWFYGDQVHINGAGCEGFAQIIDEAVRTG